MMVVTREPAGATFESISSPAWTFRRTYSRCRPRTCGIRLRDTDECQNCRKPPLNGQITTDAFAYDARERAGVTMSRTVGKQSLIEVLASMPRAHPTETRCSCGSDCRKETPGWDQFLLHCGRQCHGERLRLKATTSSRASS